MKCPSPDESCFRIDVIEECLTDLVDDYFHEQANERMNAHANFLSELQVGLEALETVYAADMTTEDQDDFGRESDELHAGRVPQTEGLVNEQCEPK